MKTNKCKTRKQSLGSSETTREAPLCKFQQELVEPESRIFNFQNYLAPEHKKKINYDFLEWFLGFCEGDASFSVTTDRNKKYLRFEIEQQDAKLLFKIRTELGYGKVYPLERSWLYQIKDKKGIQRIISLFYGNFVLPKRLLQFQHWFDVGKSVGVVPPFLEILPYQIKTKQPSLQTAWLSGFVEAEGFFLAYLDERRCSQKLHIQQKFQITQKEEYGMLEYLGQLFQSQSKIGPVEKDKPIVYRLQISSRESNEILIKYLIKFPLKGKKVVVFKRWWRLFLSHTQNKPISEATQKRLQRLCSEINKSTQQESDFKNKRG